MGSGPKKLVIGTLLFIILIIVNGCGFLRPKNVELFQDKVKAVPEKSEFLKETEKGAVFYVKGKINDARDAAIKENSTTNVVNPLTDAKIVIEPLSLSLGSPRTRWEGDAITLADQLGKENSKLDKKMDLYKENVKENQGKKIEGTGLVNISWFSMILIILASSIVVYLGVKVISIIYPVVGVGTSLARVPASVVSKAFSEILRGGELFKEKVDKTFEDQEVRNKILEMFRESQQIKQSPENQELIKKLTLLK